MDRQRRALRRVRRLDLVRERHLLGERRAGREEEPGQLGNDLVVERSSGDEAVADAERLDGLGRPRRRAAEGAAHDLEALEHGRALGDGVRLADRDEDRRHAAAWLTAATVSVMVRPETVPIASTASTRFVRSASSTSFAPSVTMTTLSRGIS